MGLQTHLASASRHTLDHFSPGLRLQIEYVLIAVVLVGASVSMKLWQIDRSLRIENKFLVGQIVDLNATIVSQEESISFLNTALGGSCRRKVENLIPPPMLPRQKTRL